GTASLRLIDALPFHVHLEPSGVDLAILDQLDPSLRLPWSVAGRVTAQAELEGTLRPTVVESNGSATIADLQAAGWQLADVDLRWHSDRSQLTLDSLEASGYGGRLAGSGQVPLEPTAAGDFRFRLEDVDLKKLAHEGLHAKVPVAGKGDAQVRGII